MDIELEARCTHCRSAQFRNLFILRIRIRKLLDMHLRDPLFLQLGQTLDKRVMRRALQVMMRRRLTRKIRDDGFRVGMLVVLECDGSGVVDEDAVLEVGEPSFRDW